jgi:hypothetical protein
MVPGITGAVALTTADDVPFGGHSCALLGDGTVRCWGANDHGQLGAPTPGDAGAAPSPSPLPAVIGLGPVAAVTAGRGFTCALLADTTARCWGDNQNGELGTGTTTAYAGPAMVKGLSGIKRLVAGGQHACAILTGGGVVCWGSNQNGEVGNGTSSVIPVPAPTPVPGVLGATAIALGSSHSCAVVAGAVGCWGANDTGELGNATPMTSSASPVPVSGVTAVRDIAAGANHTCAYLSSGAAECWGLDAVGELGTGVNGQISGPVLVTCHGGACGPCTPSCGACPAQCATPACCGAFCQTAHSTGFGGAFYDCNPLGTYNQQQAMAACAAMSGPYGNCSVRTAMCSGAPVWFVCGCGAPGVPGPGGPCWEFAGPDPGGVSIPDGGPGLAVCPTWCGVAPGPKWN